VVDVLGDSSFCNSSVTIDNGLSSGSALIWEENFNTYADSTQIGTNSRWTSLCSGCFTGDWFAVRSNLFEAQDVNDWAIWESEIISTIGHSYVRFSLDAIELGDHEGPSCNCGTGIDYFDVYYSINGGPYLVVPNWNNNGGDDLTYFDRRPCQRST
jgi:hypothetical protein